jgi:hypothetical protein
VFFDSKGSPIQVVGTSACYRTRRRSPTGSVPVGDPSSLDSRSAAVQFATVPGGTRTGRGWSNRPVTCSMSSLSSTCLYTSSVTLILKWPRMRDTTTIGTPLRSASVSQVWRRSCELISESFSPSQTIVSSYPRRSRGTERMRRSRFVTLPFRSVLERSLPGSGSCSFCSHDQSDHAIRFPRACFRSSCRCVVRLEHGLEAWRNLNVASRVTDPGALLEFKAGVDDRWW